MVSEELLTYAANSYGFDKSTLKFISDSTNQVYMFSKNEKGYILRFASRSIEHINQIKAEMDWLYYLAKHEIGISLPLKACNNELVVATTYNDSHQIISAFEMAKGQFWNKNDPKTWNEKIFFNWGKVMGDIHRLTKDYRPTSDIDIRSTFTGRNALSDSIKACPSVNDIVEELISKMMALPKDRDSFGLIHYDIHPWNFYIDDDKINVFDFDDSLYGWFALDIGIALYHGLWWGRKDDTKQIQDDFINNFIHSFLEGYLSANNLSAFWISKIPMFMKFRQICKFSWFFNPKNIDEHQKERIKNIENNVLFTNCSIDQSIFSSLR